MDPTSTDNILYYQGGFHYIHIYSINTNIKFTIECVAVNKLLFLDTGMCGLVKLAFYGLLHTKCPHTWINISSSTQIPSQPQTFCCDGLVTQAGQGSDLLVEAELAYNGY